MADKVGDLRNKVNEYSQKSEREVVALSRQLRLLAEGAPTAVDGFDSKEFLELWRKIEEEHRNNYWVIIENLDGF